MVQTSLLSSLENTLGSEHVLHDEELMHPYAQDETPGLYSMPDFVAKPGNASQVSQVLRLAARHGVPVTPRGLGTGLSGGCVAIRGGIVVSMERMNRLLEIDEENLMAVVEPGMVVGELHERVEELGLFYPPDPASLENCSIGGNLAENAGGPRAFKYGVTRHYVCGVEAVLPSGEVITYGGKVIKNCTGYDLGHLLVGSEGTLGIFTKITLRLRPLPAFQVDLLIPFGDFQTAAHTVTKVIRAKRLVPALLEFTDGNTFRMAHEALGKTPVFPNADALLMVGLDGNSEESVMRECDEVGSLCLEQGALDVMVASNRAQKERLWEVRRKTFDVIKATSDRVHLEDVVVPRARIPDFIEKVRRVSRGSGIPIATWGHAGDGNIHVTLMKREVDEDLWQAKLPVVTESIIDTALCLGGTITGEHGVGLVKRRFLPKAYGEAELGLMRKIKSALDPLDIMNPGKAL